MLEPWTSLSIADIMQTIEGLPKFDFNDNEENLYTNLNITAVEQVDSTNKALRQLTTLSSPQGRILIAREQTKGHGKWGNSWESPPGGIYLSMTLAIEGIPLLAHLVTLSVSWGIASALRSLSIPATIKWPNDLLLAGHKLCGIIVKSRSRGNELDGSILGVGFNWDNPVPPEGIALKPWLVEAGLPVPSLETIVGYIIWGIIEGRHQWQTYRAEGMADSYNAMFSHQGQWVTWEGRPVQVEGIDEEGDLLLFDPELGDEEGWIAAEVGEVSLDYPITPSAD
jgi:BirA family biotin operon repressor/biotin-[acetyl-CoA-carboxylase] ligase